MDGPTYEDCGLPNPYEAKVALAELRAEVERLAALTELDALKGERKRCIRIVNECLDTGEYERSLAQSIVARIRALEGK
jgi:hypothetical protein